MVENMQKSCEYHIGDYHNKMSLRPRLPQNGKLTTNLRPDILKYEDLRSLQAKTEVHETVEK